MAQVAGFALTPLDISDFPTRHNYGLALWQNHIERILAGWVGELAVPIYRGREVTGFAQDDTGVDVELSDGRSLRAEYLVGCDGGRSLVRKEGRHRVPRVGSDDQLPDRRGRDGRGAGVGRPPGRPAASIAFGRLEYEVRDGEVIYMDGGPVRIMVTEGHAGPERRTHPGRSQRGAHRRLRDRLRSPQPPPGSPGSPI